MKTSNIKYKISSLLIGGMSMCGLLGCNDESVPSEYLPEQYLKLQVHEMNIGIDPTFEIGVQASSTWEVSSSADWINIEEPRSYGETSVICKADANRGEQVRSCYVVVRSFFKENAIVDSVKIVQEVNNLPILEVIPAKDILVSSDGELLDMTVTYNFGVRMIVNYLSGDTEWISFAPGILPIVNKQPVNEDVKLSISPNDVEEQRVAEITMESTEEGGIPVKFKVTQKAMLPLIPAVTAFSDNFETVTTQGALYTGEGWTFEANPADRNITFKQFTNSMKALLIHGGGTQAVAYGIMCPFNVRDMKNKSLSYRWAPGNAIAAGTEKFEVVASTDYKDDAFKATWTVVEDVTNTENPTKVRPLTLRTVDLSDLENEERVYIAFRYTGANSAYRFDDVKVGDVE